MDLSKLLSKNADTALRDEIWEHEELRRKSEVARHKAEMVAKLVAPPDPTVNRVVQLEDKVAKLERCIQVLLDQMDVYDAQLEALKRHKVTKKGPRT